MKDFIERLEEAGQFNFINSNKLPIEGSCSGKEYTDRGLKFKPSDDPLFYEVDMPGYDLRPAGGWNSYWSDLFDPRGRKIASIFYKCPPYDMRAFIRFTRRYDIQNTLESPRKFIIKDNQTMQIIFETIDTSDDSWKKINAWIDENYPNHRDAKAYWD